MLAAAPRARPALRLPKVETAADVDRVLAGSGRAGGPG